MLTVTGIFVVKTPVFSDNVRSTYSEDSWALMRSRKYQQHAQGICYKKEGLTVYLSKGTDE